MFGLERIPGGLMRISVSSNGNVVWGVNSGQGIYYRTGITINKLAGINWQNIGGGLRQISVNNNSLVWGTNASNQVFRRTGITANNPAGTNWEHLRQQNGFWVSVAENNQIWLAGTDKNTYFWENNNWKRIDNAVPLIVISADEGNVWGISEDGKVYYRLGITKENPIGTLWQNVDTSKLGTTRLTYLQIRGNQLWLTADGEVWIRQGITAENPTGTEWQYWGTGFKTISPVMFQDGKKKYFWATGNDDTIWMVYTKYEQEKTNGMQSQNQFQAQVTNLSQQITQLTELLTGVPQTQVEIKAQVQQTNLPPK